MNEQQILEILKDHQKYRLGQGEYSEVGVTPKYKPKELTEAIDYCINLLSPR